MANDGGARPNPRPTRSTGGFRGNRVVFGVFITILLFFGIGTAILNAYSWSDADEADRAPACATAEQAEVGADCVTWSTATIVSFVNTGGKNSHHNLTVDPGSEQIDFQGGNALLADDRIGTTVQVENWENKQIAVRAGPLVVLTQDSPLVERTDITAGSMICFGLGSFMMAMTFGVGDYGAVSRNAFSASSFLRVRNSPGGVAAAIRISVICWSVVATVAGFIMLVKSMTVNAPFTIAVSVTEAVDLVAVLVLVYSAYTHFRARRRAAAGLYT